MSDLSTSYLGLSLKNPLIIGSSTLVQNIHGVMEAEESGAGAIVIRSLFEELIREKEEKASGVYSGHPEEYDYILSELNMQYGAQNYLDFVREAKSKCQGYASPARRQVANPWIIAKSSRQIPCMGNQKTP